MFQDKAVCGENADYFQFSDRVIPIIKTLLMLSIVIIFVFLPVIIPVLGIVNSPAGIIILYAAFIIVNCVATTSILDVYTTLAVQLAYAAILGNALFQKYGV